MSDRFILKQFAGNATNDDVHGTGIFGSCKAGSPTLTTDFKQVQSLSAYENGWADATFTNDKLPPANEMQGLQGLLCKAIKEVYSEGIPEWIDGETYYLNSFVQYNGVVYRNITGTSTSTSPDLDTTNWLDILSQYALLDAENIFTKKQNIKNATELGLYITRTDLANSDVTPASTAGFGGIVCLANNNEICGRFGNYLDDTGTTESFMYARRKISGTNKTCQISLKVDSNGDIATSCPTPPAGDNSTQIATTAWVNTNVDAANKDLSNVTAAGKNTAIVWGFPDYSNETTISNNYTAPKHGWIRSRLGSNSGETRTVSIDGKVVAYNYTAGAGYVQTQTWAPIAKGQIVTMTSAGVAVHYFPCKNSS